MPPMCMYSADNTGFANDFHFAHYTSRAIGGTGLIILEATGVVPNGRITDNDLGIWSDNHIEGLGKIVQSIKSFGSKAAIQLSHAGRKCEIMNDTIFSPSPIQYSDRYQIPKELSKDDIKNIINNFRDAAERAEKAGFDAIELHGAHGYLIHQFLSPITNQRQDEYGGALQNRVRFLIEILEEVKKAWPSEKPILLRVSASDYKEGGINIEEMIKIVNMVKPYIDIVHVSSGGLISVPIKAYPGYQVKFCERIKWECSIPAIAVGLIDNVSQVEEILNNERADLVALGRELLRNPYWTLNTAKSNNVTLKYPIQYERAFK